MCSYLRKCVFMCSSQGTVPDQRPRCLCFPAGGVHSHAARWGTWPVAHQLRVRSSLHSHHQTYCTSTVQTGWCHLDWTWSEFIHFYINKLTILNIMQIIYYQISLAVISFTRSVVHPCCSLHNSGFFMLHYKKIKCNKLNYLLWESKTWCRNSVTMQSQRTEWDRVFPL